MGDLPIPPLDLATPSFTIQPHTSDARTDTTIPKLLGEALFLHPSRASNSSTNSTNSNSSNNSINSNNSTNSNSTRSSRSSATLTVTNSLSDEEVTIGSKSSGDDNMWKSLGSLDSISTSSTTISTLSDNSSAFGVAPTSAEKSLKIPMDSDPPPNGNGIGMGIGIGVKSSVIDVVVKPPTSRAYPVTKEMWWNTTVQIAVPFFLAGCGTIGAGYVLSVVQDWLVFKNIKALFILVPSLVGLKGNLDTCLASRLSTQANLGNLNNRRKTLTMFTGNVGLVQVQAIISSLLVAIFAISVSSALEQDIKLKNVLVVCASAMSAATISCFVLDIVLISVIVVSKMCNINPDNIASPFAASIGDIVSLSLLSIIASLVYTGYDEFSWIPWLIIAFYLIICLPFWIWLVIKNSYVRPVLTSGWVPILSALLISGTGGIVLDSAVNIYNGFVVFQPIINGIGGNLVSIQSSRIATMLHQSAELGTLPPQSPSRLVKPWRPLFGGLPHAATARILLAIAIPGHLAFIFVADVLYAGYVSLSWEFVLIYLFFALLQVTILLYMAHILTHVMWVRKIDPDSAAVPFLTATGDLLGTGLLFIVFIFLHLINKDYLNIPSPP